MPKHLVLVVEDDEPLRRGVCDLLGVAGYDAAGAPDGVAALRLLENFPSLPDLIISDIAMPNMDGYELLAAVRARTDWLSIPFIFLTARTQKEEIRTGKLRGADDYVTKPFDLPDLLVAVQSAINRHEQIGAVQQQEMENLRQQILKVLHHEFRTPLHYIVAYADLMANTPSFEHSAELRQYITGIMEGSERLSRLIDSLLILAELESGNGRRIFDLRKTLIEDMEGLVIEAIEPFKSKAVERGLVLDVTAEDELPPVLGDRLYLQAAVSHMVENAIKFSPEGGRISVTLSPEADDESLHIIVCDEGIGIPAEARKRLFEAFYQVEREHYEQQGVGAGLAIAHHVAELHGGQLSVVSQPDSGSSFRLALPAHRPSNCPASPEA